MPVTKRLAKVWPEVAGQTAILDQGRLGQEATSSEKPMMVGRASILIFFLSLFLSSFGFARGEGEPGPCATYFARLRGTDTWQFTPEFEAKIQNVLHDGASSPESRVQSLFQLLLNERLAQAPPASRFFLQSVAEDIDKQSSLYSRAANYLIGPYKGPHYNPIFNRTAVPEYLFNGPEDVSSVLVKFHEFEHAFDRNTNPTLWSAQVVAMSKELLMTLRTPVTPAAIFRAEGRAIGSQWEIVTRLPEKIRKGQLKKLESVHRMYRDELVGIQVQGLRKSLAKATGLPPEDLATGYFKLSAGKRREFYDKFQKSFQEMNRSAGIRLSRNEFERVLKSEVFLEAVKRPKMQQPLNQIPIMQLKMVQIARASLEKATLSKEKFIEEMRPIHGYTSSAVLKNHYDPTNILWTMMAATSLTTAQSVYDLRHDKERANQQANFIPSPEISYLMKLYIGLMSPDPETHMWQSTFEQTIDQ